MSKFDFESLTYQHFDDNYPGPRRADLGVKTVFGSDPRERYRQVSLKRMLDHLNGRTPTPLPTFPNGWFGIAIASDLRAREVRPLNIFGRDVVLFRGSSGSVHLLDAYCPHLGAHLGHGGKVAGDDLVCPFHAWRFDGQGRCRNVPYSDEIPPDSTIRAWPIRERNGLLFAWFHAEGKAPDWEISELPQFSDPDMRIAGHRCTYFTAHVQDVLENGVDLPHFRTLHKWEADQVEWSIHGPEYRMAYRIETMRDKNRVAPQIHSTTQGPGYTFTTFDGSLRGVSTHAMTHVEPSVFQLLQIYVYHKDIPDQVCEAAMEGSSFEWASDIPVWENKKIWLRPKLTADDGPVGAYRRWFNQFYSEPVDQGDSDEKKLRNVKEIADGRFVMGPAVRREAEGR